MRSALVGGLAVSARAEPRLTRDADFAVGVASDAQAESLVHSLVERGYRLVATVEQETAERLATVRLTQSDTDHSVVVDLLFASSGIEPEIVDAAERLEILPNLQVPVATVGHLMALKVLARDDRQRPADADDLRSLASIATDDDWNEAIDAARLITSRGFDRGRDLLTSVEELRTS